MEIYIDTGWVGLSKHGEELCGDNVEVVKTGEAVVAVLADGLGSGVKANILSKMTAKIIATMFEKGAELKEVVDTISNTLPVCQKRNLAYSTFTIIQVKGNGEAYIVEFDNPAVIILRDGKLMQTESRENEYCGKKVKECRFKSTPGDTIVAVSDGIVHAGIGGILNLGWQWEHVAHFIEGDSKKKLSAAGLSSSLLGVCEELYAGKPGDDATVLTIQIRKLRTLTLAVGPPENPADDSLLVNLIRSEQGSKVICGGTTSIIVAKGFGGKIEVDLERLDPVIPPTGRLKGVNLVTEGIITLSKALELIKPCRMPEELPQGNNGAIDLAHYLLESDRINFVVGRAINPAHQNPNLPVNLALKMQVVNELANVLKKLGKQVEVQYL